jgi:hypothetical protein
VSERLFDHFDEVSTRLDAVEVLEDVLFPVPIGEAIVEPASMTSRISPPVTDEHSSRGGLVVDCGCRRQGHPATRRSGRCSSVVHNSPWPRQRPIVQSGRGCVAVDG